jgi:cephalosporin hydroxylase
LASNTHNRGDALWRLREARVQAFAWLWKRTFSRLVGRLFHYDIVVNTGNFATTTWAGVPIWQNILDLWTIQETIAEIRPTLLVEVGTHRGGSALFYADVMDRLDVGQVVSIDIRQSHDLQHPRITFLEGDSTDPLTVRQVGAAAADTQGPVMVILDGDHSRDHVAAELELYAPFVTPGSYLLSQDGIIDRMRLFRDNRPGPLDANRRFLSRHPEFEHDATRNRRFNLTHHPLGWLRRRNDGVA